MKRNRILSLLLVAVMLFTTVAVFATDELPPAMFPSEIVYGDANGDDVVDGKDVLLILQYLAAYDYDQGMSSVAVRPGADADGDGEIDGRDVIQIKKYLAAYDHENNVPGMVLGPENPPKAAMTGSVTLSGSGKADSTVTAQVTTEAEGALSYEWVLDGKTLQTKTETLQIPASAEGKSLICRVSAADRDGTVASAPLTVSARRAGNTYTMAGLWEDVKWFNRTLPVGTAMTANWSASGFEANVYTETATDFRVYYYVQNAMYFVVLVDGVQVDRPYLPGASAGISGFFGVEIPAGEHTIRVCRENELNTSNPPLTCNLTQVEFAGEFLAPPADSDLYIQFIGDSICCGDGSLGTKQPGVGWVTVEHSATHGFGYLTAQELGTDFELVARGGIGLLAPAGDYVMGDIYDYVDRYRFPEEMVDYDTARVPDVIVVEMGANDSASVYGEEAFYEALLSFVQHLREKWGYKPSIVWIGKSVGHYGSAQRVKEALNDPRYFAMQYSYGSSGSGPASKDVGHPSAAEQQEMAEALSTFLLNNGIV